MFRAAAEGCLPGTPAPGAAAAPFGRNRRALPVAGAMPSPPCAAEPAKRGMHGPSRFGLSQLTHDLGSDIGSRRWFRGLATFFGMTAGALAFWPGFAPLEAAPLMPSDADVRGEYRRQAIAPLALGADTGRRIGPGTLVRPLASAPERPRLEMVATLGRGDGFETMLRRAGMDPADARQVTALVGGTVAVGEIEPGTRVDLVLGRRPAVSAPRPLDTLSLRARFDLELAVTRATPGGPLVLERKPIRVDDTPLRVRGIVGDSLYRSARAAGAPASAVQAYLKALTDQIDLERELRPGDTFDIILSHRRAATGERLAGQLLYAGVERDGQRKVQLMRWGREGRFFEASGIGEQKDGLIAPVAGPVGSRFGMRRHPILGYRRMHAGLDYRARHGTPIVAVTDGQVTGAGRMGGCGYAVRLRHGGALDTRYCHMSRIAVNAGQSVRRGQVIGYVGSTGLSTGPHLHYEMYRGGRAVDPASVRYVTRAMLSGEELARFRATLARIREVEAGAAFGSLPKPAAAPSGPRREIDRLD